MIHALSLVGAATHERTAHLHSLWHTLPFHKKTASRVKQRKAKTRIFSHIGHRNVFLKGFQIESKLPTVLNLQPVNSTFHIF
jgi:hypothetical protein